MPDYIQLLESKLSPNQKQALNAMTDVVRARGIPVFLTGGAVRDIISGASVRDLDITVQGNPFKFRKDLEKAGFVITGDHEPSQTLYLRYGRRARLEISAARTESFPKPARPEYRPSAILGDLHRRDFTANSMALSLNEGSWGLLLDPLNGTADIYARQLRLVSNYGFLEDPIRLVRATRLLARTGWEMEERTRTRYENAKAEDVINAIPAAQRGYELEEIAYEEEPLHALKSLDSEGWLKHLSTNWSSKSADAAGLEKLHERLVKLLMAGLHPDPSAAQFRLLTAKLSPANLSALKRLFVRKDLIDEADALDREAKKVLQQITAKTASKPSQLWKLFHEVSPEAVLWLYFTGKGAAIQNKFENFFTKWPEARQKIPNALLQEMRIVPDTPGYDELLDKLTFAFMDNELPNDEAIRKMAEPYSPPPPPAPVVVRRSRAVKRVVEPKAKGKKAKKAAAAGEATPVEPGTAEAAVAAAASTPLTGKKAGAAKPESKAAAGKEKAAGAAKKPEPAAKSKTVEKTAKEKPVAAKSGKVATAKAAQAKAKPSKSVVKSSVRPSKKGAAAKGTAKKPAVKTKAPAKTSAKSKAAPKPAAAKTKKPVAAVKKAVSKAKVKAAGKAAARPKPAAKKKSGR